MAGTETLGKVLMLFGDADGAAQGETALDPLLEQAGFDVVVARSGEEAVSQAVGQRPRAVLLDLDGCGASGYLVCKLLRERYGDLLPIVLLSGDRAEPSDRVAGLLIGADDYVSKPFNPSELVARLQRLVARSAAQEERVALATRGDVGDDFGLTRREQQVMALLVGGMTQTEIARELVISTNTVATHIQRILVKLGVHNRAQAVAKAAREGWLQRDSQPVGAALG